MKAVYVTIVCLLVFYIGHSQSVLGKWKIIKEDTGEVRSIVEIYEAHGKINGKVIEIIDKTKENNLCVKCEGENKNQKILGLVLLKDFIKDENEYVDGTILNPNDGKIYNSKIWVDNENPNMLNVRGYIGIFYKTMTWKRLQEPDHSLN